MREVNEAWHVLQDPARRRSYDDSRISGSSSSATTPGGRPRPAAVVPAADEDDDDLVDVLPELTGLTAGLFRHLPWVVLVGVFALIFVGSAYASHDAADVAPARSGTVGSCLDVASGPTTTIVPCSGPHELEIEARVDRAAACPAGTEARRLATDGLLDCVSEG
ncbi:MAG: hypothetical protein JWM47_1667 [Acidimicrobiales bacterium]|nr:hypothetical protein [Acidimicrobiales bacterium]